METEELLLRSGRSCWADRVNTHRTGGPSEAAGLQPAKGGHPDTLVELSGRQLGLVDTCGGVSCEPCVKISPARL